MAVQEDLLLWVGVVILALLMMARSSWPASKATRTRTSSSPAHAHPVAGCPTGIALETRAAELEAAGDLDGAMKALLASHHEGSSRAATLAHELSQRCPAEKLEEMGCPLIDRSRQLASGTVGNPAASCVGAAVASEFLAVEGNIDGESGQVAVENGDRESPPCAVEQSLHEDCGEDAGTEERRTVSAAAAMAKKRAMMQGHRHGRDEGGGESTTTLLPWERGWQGAEGFKPPSSTALWTTETDATTNPAASTEVLLAGSSSSTFTVTGAETGEKRNNRDPGEALPAVRRNFTISQINSFDGGVSVRRTRGGGAIEGKQRPIYIALSGEVYDVSAGRHLYGPGGEYSEFAGHDISRRVARGVSRRNGNNVVDSSGSSALLDDLSLDGLDRFEKMTLRGWEDMFRARAYPRVGRVVLPPAPRLFSRAELRAFDGRPSAVTAAEEGGGAGGRAAAKGGERGLGGEPGGRSASLGVGAAARSKLPKEHPKARPLPANYAARPIYIGVKDKVFDVSFGGSEFYLEGGPYECLAGRDASRVLAKMSMAREDVEGVLDYTCLTDREEKNLADWVEKLGAGGKGYPVVGWIDLGLE